MSKLKIISVLLLQCITTAFAFHATSTPPLLDVPVYSLSTLGNDGQPDDSTMNILTYASPLGITPHYRTWSISLYKGTKSHANFVRERRGILQLLSPEHALCKGDTGVKGELIRVLGGSSGYDVDKKTICDTLGYAWGKQSDEIDGEDGGEWPLVLPECCYYLKLELIGDMIDCGSHEVALCKVVSMISSEEIINTKDELNALSTRQLRNDGIISELGRVIPLEDIDDDKDTKGSDDNILKRRDDDIEYDSLDQVLGQLDVY